MNCPKCQNPLREREREVSAGDIVVMDACPACGGIWLDRGELEKLTRLEDRYYDNNNDQRRNDRWDDDDDDDRRGGQNGFGGGAQGARGGRRNGFLGSLFEGFAND